MLNRIDLIGRVGKDPEIRFMPGGDGLANVSLATTESYKDRNGERKEVTDWHKLVFRGKMVETVEKYVKKGNLLYVSGASKTRTYEKDGKPHYITEVFVKEMKFLGGKGEGSTRSTGERQSDRDENTGSGDASTASQAPASNDANKKGGSKFDQFDDDAPF